MNHENPDEILETLIETVFLTKLTAIFLFLTYLELLNTGLHVHH